MADLATATEAKGVPYDYAELEVIQAHSWEGTGRFRRQTERWYVHTQAKPGKTEPGVWYLVEYRQRFLCCSCRHGQVRFSAFVELNDDDHPVTLERARQLDKRLTETCAHLRAQAAYVAMENEANRVERPSFPINPGLSDQ